MSNFAMVAPIVGTSLPDFLVPDTTQRYVLGTKFLAFDPLGVFGFGDFIYGQANGTIDANSICVAADGHLWTENPTTANSGKGVAVAKAAMTSGQFGWFQLAGDMVPVQTAASVAAGSPVGIDAAAAGQAAANSAGRQLLGATSLRASAATRTFANSVSRTGSKVIQLATQAAGAFIGQAASGTGLAGGSVVTGISADGKQITLNNAVTTGNGGFTLTLTNTGYIEIAALNGLILQGAIT